MITQFPDATLDAILLKLVPLSTNFHGRVVLQLFGPIRHAIDLLNGILQVRQNPLQFPEDFAF
jgi:hypothetical protein